jgi:hypothetical protein
MTPEDQIEVLKKESEHWKFVAAYLASCHAATLESLPKSASKYLRDRLVKICEKSVSFLTGESSPPSGGHATKASVIAWDIDRCRRASAEHANK